MSLLSTSPLVPGISSLRLRYYLRYGALAVLLSLGSRVATAQTAAPCPDCDARYGALMQSYYRQPDPQVVELTVEYLNRQTASAAAKADLLNHAASYRGFYAALATKDIALRQAFTASQPRILDPEARQLLSTSLAQPADSLFARTALSPGYNDMAWAAYFATGDTRFVDLLLRNCQYSAERKDRNLYFTGASARWSLCSVARQDEQVRAYLTTQQRKSAEARLLLKAEPAALKKQMVDIYVQHQQKGSWQ